MGLDFLVRSTEDNKAVTVDISAYIPDAMAMAVRDGATKKCHNDMKL